jgi:hypothetical protein
MFNKKIKNVLAIFAFSLLTIMYANLFGKGPTYCYYICQSGEILSCEIEDCETHTGYIDCGGSILACH